MPSPDDRRLASPGAKLSLFAQRHSLWLLLGCYALATAWPAPGRTMHQWGWVLSPAANVRLTLPLLLLALMLFCAALLTNPSQIRSVGQRPMALVWALLAVWLGPALLVVAAGGLVPWLVNGRETSGLLVGLALVASMPVANSSVGWTQNARGNLALGLALVLVSISLCPWLTPRLLGWLGLSLSVAERVDCDALVANFSGTFFVIWVILPTVAGIACRYVVGSERVNSAANVIRSISLAALLALNYVNAALAFPEVFEQSHPSLLVTTVLLAAALSVVGLMAAYAIGRLLRLPRDAQSSLLFGISMKHTGLALVLAGDMFREQPLAILMIVLATLMQHLLAGLVQWRLREETAPRNNA